MPARLEPPMPTVRVPRQQVLQSWWLWVWKKLCLWPSGFVTEFCSGYSSAAMSALLGWLVSLRKRHVCWHRNSHVPDYVCKGIFWMVAKCCQCRGAAVQVQLPPARCKAPTVLLPTVGDDIAHLIEVSLLREERHVQPLRVLGMMTQH